MLDRDQHKPLLSREWSAFKIALQFLTQIPTGLATEYSPELLQRSLLWYPIAGMVIGLVLQFVGWLLPIQTNGFFNAALLLLVWLLLTGALHLDGLADTADAWVGGIGDREKTLAIMKDPRVGPVAVIALLITLLLKAAALTALFENNAVGFIWLVPVVSRSLVLLSFLLLPYVSSDGLGAALKQPTNMPSLVVLAVVVLLLGLFLPSGLWLLWLLVALTGFWYWRRLMLTRLQGFTGDCLGALIELAEVALLVSAVFWVIGLG